MSRKVNRELPVTVIKSPVVAEYDNLKTFAHWLVEWGIREKILPAPAGYNVKTREVKEA